MTGTGDELREKILKYLYDEGCDFNHNVKAMSRELAALVLADQPDTVAVTKEQIGEIIEDMEDMRSYVPEYFQEKWDHVGAINKVRALLEES